MTIRSIKFFANMGVVPGYGHNNVTEANALDIVGQAWQEAAGHIYSTKNIYITAVLSPARTVYHPDWGCPKNGEITVTITGECNPKYTEPKTYKETVTEVVTLVAKKLQQQTTQICFTEVDFEYVDLRNTEDVH